MSTAINHLRNGIQRAAEENLAMEEERRMSKVNQGKELAGESTESPRPAHARLRLPIYVASRASTPDRPAMWRRFRDSGFLIVSSWIDESGDGQTEDFSELWQRISDEVASACGVVLYAESDDFPLKGALIEVGIALGLNKPVIVCLPNVTLDPRSCRPIGSWINHPLVSRVDDVGAAIKAMSCGRVW